MQAHAERDQLAPPRPPARLRALGLALLVHGLLIAALTWGVNWKSSEPLQAAMQAELWSALPQQAAPPEMALPPPPAPAEAPRPPRPPAAAPVTPPPPPPPRAVPAQDDREADIAIEREKKRLEKQKKERQQQLERDKREREKREQERERKEEERKERLEQAKKERLQKEKDQRDKERREQVAEQKKAEQDKLDKQKKQAEDKRKAEEADAKRKAEAEAKHKAEADAKRKADAEAKRKSDAEAKQLAAQREANMRRLMGMAGATGAENATGNAKQDSSPQAGKGSGSGNGPPSAAYGGRVAAKVKPNIVYPDALLGNPRAVVAVRAAPDGTITQIKVIESSGNKAWDDAVVRALEKTAALPRDADGRVPPALEIGFRPQD
ncbi:MAG: cell envelope integrity protein TolA [Burkholderiaceae bacterium]|nr:cell envelope integrity protein TolA [Burkholderiaceae bacterium]